VLCAYAKVCASRLTRSTPRSARVSSLVASCTVFFKKEEVYLQRARGSFVYRSRCVIANCLERGVFRRGVA